MEKKWTRVTLCRFTGSFRTKSYNEYYALRILFQGYDLNRFMYLAYLKTSNWFWMTKLDVISTLSIFIFYCCDFFWYVGMFGCYNSNFLEVDFFEWVFFQVSGGKSSTVLMLLQHNNYTLIKKCWRNRISFTMEMPFRILFNKHDKIRLSIATLIYNPISDLLKWPNVVL